MKLMNIMNRLQIMSIIVRSDGASLENIILLIENAVHRHEKVFITSTNFSDIINWVIINSTDFYYHMIPSLPFTY